jgi:BASS family bile acid:Na+ symporter
MASNVITMAARGHVSYSVSITTSSTMLSPIAVPLALLPTLGQFREFDALGVFRDLVLTVVLPVGVGHLLARSTHSAERLMRRIGPVAAQITILWIIAVVVGTNRDRLQQATPLLAGVLLLINLLGYLAGYGGASAMGLPESMRRALAIEVGMQNCGLGTMLLATMFPDQPAATIPTALYTFGCMFTGTVLASVWGRRDPEAAGAALEERHS